MSDRVCCRILSQIPLLKYSDLGIVVRLQASRYISDDDNNTVIFDVFVNDIVPTKSTYFSNISVNGSGDMIQISSLSCCVVAVIPWKENSINIKRLSTNKKEKKFKKIPHKYGLFEEELNEIELNNELINKIDIGNNCHNSIAGEIPLIKGITVLSITGTSILQLNIDNNPNLICEKWYNLDDYTLFILLNETYMGYSYSRILIFDLINLINDDNEEVNDDIFLVNEFEFKTSIVEGMTVFPVDFSFGRGPDIWNMLGLFLLFDNNTIKTICPVITNRMKLPYFAYEVFFSSLIEQEFIFEAKNNVIDANSDSDLSEFKYDKCLYDVLVLLTNDLRNPIDDKTGEIIDDHIQINIPIETYKLNLKDCFPNQVELKLNWEPHFQSDLNDIKSTKLSFITNYPLSVFIVINSKNIIGLFTSSYLSFPSFKQNKNNELESDNFLLLVQSYTIPNDWCPLNNSTERNNIVIYDKFKYDKNISNDKVDKTLFTIGISIFDTLAIIHIDWLQFIFSLHLNCNSANSNEYKICNECKECGDKQLKIYNNIEAVRAYLDENKELSIYKLCNVEFLNLSECCLGFTASFRHEFSGNNENCCNLEQKLMNENVNVKFIYPFIDNKNINSVNPNGLSSASDANSEYKNAKFNDAKLVSLKYDELPFVTYNDIFLIKSVNKDYFLSKKLLEKIKLLSKNTTYSDKSDDFKIYNTEEKIINNKNMVDSICEYDTEKVFKYYFENLKKIKSEFKNINDTEEITNYHLKLLKLFNELNKAVLVRINSQLTPITNLMYNIKSRIKLLKKLKSNISKTHTQIANNEEKINKKIRDTIENSERLQERIKNIKKMFVHELNIHRIKFNQEVIIPEILLMLSNVQLELCSCIVNVFNSNYNSTNHNKNTNLGQTASGIETEASSGFGVGVKVEAEYETGIEGASTIQGNNGVNHLNNHDYMNDINAKLQNYINHNKSVLDRFQSMQTKVIELNKYLKD
ncbi:hypothetical protein FG379_001651 [Cryptosporidium bovis]|uniref:uncharacterized protein n=1 Tax=Cryptosporidium bovis TaxID=310047 RepID=UPI00351A998D|nr:hypothetical protein FG379_001651 [Cryptosporidium bovis]